MKKLALYFLASTLMITSLWAQTPSKEDNLKFSRDFMSCHQLINCALNYNTQPEIYFAFLKEADRYLVAAQTKFNANKEKWTALITQAKAEDVTFLFEEYQKFTMRDRPLTVSEMQSATMWLRIADTKNRDVVRKLIE